MDMKPKKRIGYFWRILLLILVVLVLARVYYRTTDDFRIANITNEMPYHPEWETLPLSKADQAEIDRILKQKFSYVGKGAQSYVFVSDDQRHVLKFFKFKHLRPSLLSSLLPNFPPFAEFRQQDILRKHRKLNSVFVGYKLAYDVNKGESGLVYIQLNPNHIKKEVTVIDKIGLERTIDLGSVVYVIQNTAQTLRTTLSSLLEQGNVELTKQRIGQIFDLYMSEYRKGIYDRDHGVMHNTGFVGDNPIHLDVGKLTKDDRMQQPEVSRDDLAKIASKIALWIKNNYSQYYPQLFEDMQAKFKSLYGQPFANARTRDRICKKHQKPA